MASRDEAMECRTVVNFAADGMQVDSVLLVRLLRNSTDRTPGNNNIIEEALLLQKNRATRYVSNFVLRFTRYGTQNGFKHF